MHAGAGDGLDRLLEGNALLADLNTINDDNPGDQGVEAAASAANATIEHMRDWALGTPEGDWVSMAVPSDGSYGVPEGLISSFPCTFSGGKYEIVQGLSLDGFSQAKLQASIDELLDEKQAVTELGLI